MNTTLTPEDKHIQRLHGMDAFDCLPRSLRNAINYANSYVDHNRVIDYYLALSWKEKSIKQCIEDVHKYKKDFLRIGNG